jgi:two-component system, OmpR family, sensor histidine kinase TctE
MKLSLEPFFPSIRRWLLWVLSVSLTAVMVVSGWLQYLTLDEPISAALDHALLDDAYAVSAYVRAGPAGITFELPPGAEEILRTDPDDAFYFLVTGPQGRYVAGDRDFPVAANMLPGRDEIFEVKYRGEPVRGISYRHPTELGDVTVHIAQTLRVRQSIEAEVAVGLLMSETVQIGLNLFIVYLVVGTGLRPLLRLSREIDTRGSEVLVPVSDRGLPSEL